MSQPPTTGVVDAGTKTAAKIIDTISSPVLITMIVVFGALIGGIMYLWNAQSERNRELWINLVTECVPNNYNKE
jgi:hypothetical protein